MADTSAPISSEHDEGGLKRSITGRLLFFYVLGDVLGSGIYVLIGAVAGEVGGAFWAAFAVGVTVAAFTGLAYAELATKYPQAAGASLYVNKAFDNSDTMEAYIDEILSLLVLYPTSALGLVKQSVNVASRPLLRDTVGDANRFLQAASQPDAQKMIGKVLELTDNQSAGDVELYLGERIPLLYE